MAKRKFKLFDSQREGKGVYKSNIEKTPGLKKFWRIYRENFFNRLLYINIIFIVGNLPIIFWIMALAGIGQAKVIMPNDGMFSILWGIGDLSGQQTPASLAMLGASGVQGVTYVNTFVTYLFWGLGCLAFLTWGIINTGIAYILRNLSTEKPIFIFSDMIDMIKKNWKQSLPFGILDLLLLVLLPYNLYLSYTGSGFLSGMFVGLTLIFIIVYLIMRWYIYLQIVSFKMKMTKIIKNALYFVLLGIKRNALALLGHLILVGLTVMFLFAFNGMLVVVALFIPALMLFSHCYFMGYYAAWYKIDEIMVIHDDENTSETEDDEEDDEDSEDDENDDDVILTDSEEPVTE